MEVGGSFRARDALAGGHTRHEVERLLPAPFWGIRSDESDFSTAARCRQFMPRMPSGAFYSHTTAALLWGLTLPPWLQHDIRLHVSVPRGRRAVDADRIIGHQVAVGPNAVAHTQGVPVSAPARMWRELSAHLTVPDLVAAGDELLSVVRPLCTIAELQESARAPGARGRRTMLAALPLVDGHSESRPESLMRVALVTAGVPPLLVNEDVRARDGRFVARVDLLFADFPVAVEYDGDHHRTDGTQWRRDVTRYAELADVGIDVVRATSADLPSFRALVMRTKARLRKHGWRP